MQDAFRNLVVARCVPHIGRADENAIDIGPILVVDGAERKRGRVDDRMLLFVDHERPAIPYPTVEVGLGVLLGDFGKVGGLPVRIVEVRRGGGVAGVDCGQLFHPRGEVDLELLGAAVLPRLRDGAALAGLLAEIAAEGLGGLVGNPGLDGRAGPGRLDEADRDVGHRLLQRLPEEVADGGEGLCVRGVAGRPAVVVRQVALRRERGAVAVVEEADPRVHVRLDVLLPAREPPAVVHVHVRLAGAEPDIANEDVLGARARAVRRGRGAEGMGELGCAELVRTASGMRRKLDAPASILADRRRHFAWFRVRLVRTDESDRDLCPRLRRSPDRDGDVPLQNGVVAEHRREGDRRGRACGRGRKRGNDERRCAAQ